MSRVLMPLFIGVMMGLFSAAWIIGRPQTRQEERKRRQALAVRRRRREWFAGKELFADRMGSTRRGSLLMAACFGAFSLYCFTLAAAALFDELR
ncbi:hypothetical protein HC031_09055 [Planosporangium thailandense]|uniref:Transmembrane protein n=1 Tax=Planosporangium thailandense TaxID=765197 RepID=A0ABX0XWW6_9ACTN|nr:hypothetical protein [Planosporangium thailandense]NJC69865.1 hypothetical protein [Planosporangium thailandense]